MKSFLKVLLFSLVLLFVQTTNVKAEGTISGNYIVNNNITEGDVIEVKMNINNVSLSSDGKIYSLGGYIDYDREYLELVSFNGENGFEGMINNNNDKVALIDYTLENGLSYGTIATIKFKTLKSGKTELSFRNPSGTDLEKNMEVRFSSKNIEIKEQVKEVKPEVKKEVKKQIKKETKKEVKENKEIAKVETEIKPSDSIKTVFDFLSKINIFGSFKFLVRI